MRKVFEMSKMAVAMVKAFVEYQLFHRNSSDQL